MTLNLPVDAIKTEDILNTRNLDSFESRQGFHFTKSHDLSGGKGGGGGGGEERSLEITRHTRCTLPLRRYDR